MPWAAMPLCSSTRRAGACSASPRRIGRPIRLVPRMAAFTTTMPHKAGARHISARVSLPPILPLWASMWIACRSQMCRRAAPALASAPGPSAAPVIGDRAYGESADKVAVLARAVADGLLAGGVLPVLKHIPGHGRASADSHRALPVVETEEATLRKTDFAAFRALRDLPLGMTAHVVYTAIDPIAPATTSVTLIRDVIRGWLACAGLRMSDDISMGALSGAIEARARAAIAAGCDVVLHCSGEIAEMQAVASAVPVLTGKAAGRADAALGRRGQAVKEDLAA